MFFSKDDVLKWYNNINFNDERDLLIAIPYFAKKLKEIAIYYREMREFIKQSKLKYSLKGTETGIIQSIRQEILSKFTNKQYNSPIVIPIDVWRKIPELSALASDLTVEIVDLYDDTNYFDISTEHTYLSSIELVDQSVSQKFLESKGLALSSSDWLYTTTIDIDSLTDTDIPTSRRTLLQNLASQLLAEDKYIVEYTPPTIPTETFIHNFKQGENFFFWPEGPFRRSTVKKYIPLALSASGLDQVGTPGESFDEADVIFVKTVAGTDGAWLTLYTHTDVLSVMSVVVNREQSFAFKFPFPGYGLSAQDLMWTGPSLSSQPNFVFMSDDEKSAVETQYWDFLNPKLSCVPIRIGDSTLYQNAAASTKYRYADKVKVWESMPSVTDAQYSDVVKEAWMYKFTKTQLPMTVGGDTVVFWPYTTLDTDSKLEFPPGMPRRCHDVCVPMPLSNLLVPGMVAASELSAGSVFTLLQNYRDPDNYTVSLNNSMQAAWLWGETKIGNNFTYTAQPGLNLKANPGEYTKFIWDGDPTPLSKVFQGSDHATDCEYFQKKLSINDVSKCNCKQVYHTPFGHSGSIYDDNNRQCDFIALVDALNDIFKVNNLNEFTGYAMSVSSWKGNSDVNLGLWRGRDGADYTASQDFSWYINNEDCLSDWGYGAWSNDFLLMPGECYCYYRARYVDNTTLEPDMPFYRKIYDYSPCSNFTKDSFKWLSVIKDSNGEWTKDSGVDSNILIVPETVFKYKHAPASVVKAGTPTLTFVEKQENKGSVWSNYDYITINNSRRVILSLPPITRPLPPEQAPPFEIDRVANIKWLITRPDLVVEEYPNTLIVTFVPEIIGIYTVSIVADVLAKIQTYSISGIDKTPTEETFSISAVDTRQYTFSGVPAITAVTSYDQDNTTIETILCSAAGFNLSVPLFGWNYSSQVFDGQSVGAKPFWAKSYYDFSTGGIRCERRFNSEFVVTTQPEFSDIIFYYGQYTQLVNTCSRVLTWLQPITMIYYDMSVRWNKLTFNTNDFCNCSLNIVASATHIPSDILIESVVENELTEIFYFAKQDFNWVLNLTATDAIASLSSLTFSAFINSYQPWVNILNRYNPTIATLPVISNLYSVDKVGEYLTPSKLGVTVYNGKDNTYYFNGSIDSVSSVLSYNPLYCVGGVGLDGSHVNDFNITSEDDTWLKEPLPSQAGAGNINKDIQRSFQKFIPYQSFNETNNNYKLGVSQASDLQSPWLNEKWGDDKVKFTNITQVYNVDEWKIKNNLVNDDLVLSNWGVDVFNNQYCLYKKKNTNYGSIWIRTQAGTILTPTDVISTLFTSYQNYLDVYNFKDGVVCIEVFADTLFVQLKNAIFFEKLQYSYEDNALVTNFNKAKYAKFDPFSLNINIELSIPSTTQTSQLWYDEQNQKAFIAVCVTSESDKTIYLLEYNINLSTLRSVYQVKFNDIEHSENITYIVSIHLNFNISKNLINITFNCKDLNNNNAIFVLLLKNDSSIYTYKSVVYNSFNNTTQLPSINSPLHYNVTLDELKNTSLNIVITLDQEVDFKVNIDTYKHITNTNNTITYNTQTLGIEYVPFSVYIENVGTIHNSLTINTTE